MQCSYHPRTETVLRCSKCERPICSRCVVNTPVGGRCKECAQVHRLPTSLLGGRHLLQGLGAALGAGLGLGIVFGLVLALGLVPAPLFWLFVPIALVASGYLVGEAVSVSTNRKRAPGSQGLAVGGFLLSYLTLELLAPGLQLGGFYSIVAFIVGIALAISRVR